MVLQQSVCRPRISGSDAAAWNHVLDNQDQFLWARAMSEHKAYAQYLRDQPREDKPPVWKKSKSIRGVFSRRKTRPYSKLEGESDSDSDDLA
jgi:hypothetical protein